MASNTFPHFGTDALHAGQEPEQWNSRAVIPPLSMSTTFKQYEPGVPFAVSKELVAFLDNHTLVVNDACNREIQLHSTLLGQHNFEFRSVSRFKGKCGGAGTIFA